ncbi:hypothetical protein [Actinorhabdospora filicis]|uniref:hypothetical protein n=1 Tax=Actinorhabdospora filicis TaxID=1785913 RepID=UPI0025559C13|nr:hypothetical protein [Actinorhabdospora filicis]
MSDMVITALLDELDPLPFPERMRLLARRAGEWAAEGVLRARLDVLWGGDDYARGLALTLGIIGRDAGSVIAGLADPDRVIRHRAVRACRAVPVDPEVLAGLVVDAPAELRLRLYATIRRARMRGLADRLVGAVRERHGDAEAAKLLISCGEATVRELLPRIGYAAGRWDALARRHPGPVLDEAERHLSGNRLEARSWWSRYGWSVLSAAEGEPERVLSLLEGDPRLARVGAGKALTFLAAHDPRRVARLLSRHVYTGTGPSGLGAGTLRRLAALDLPVLVELGTRWDGPGEWAALLKRRPPSARAELFEALSATRPVSAEPLPEVLLDVLPRALRTREAERAIGLPAVAEDEARVLHYTAHLPFADAFPALLTATRRHLADDRAAGYGLLIACVRRSADPEALGTVLNGLDRLRNEQDPVRARFVTALSSIPPHRFTGAHAPALTAIAKDTVEARDASWSTRTALTGLAVRLLSARSEVPELLDWATSTLDGLAGTGRLYLRDLRRHLRRGDEARFIATLLPWLRRGAERAHFEPLFGVVGGLGPRAHGLAPLTELLARAAAPGNVTAVAATAISLLLDDPRERASRVEDILLGDTSTVAVHAVWRTLCTTRTDLLDLVFEGSPPAGGHLAQGVRWVPGHAQAVDRWLPRQQAAYLRLLKAVIGDAGTRLHIRAAAIAQAAHVPGGWDLVNRYVDSPNTVLDEAALAALVWTSRPAEALGLLLDRADGDRARVAVYSAGRAARFTPPSALAEPLTALLASPKVTARKEAARLLAASSVPGAMDALHATWSTGPHRDVKAAIVSAVRHLLDDPRAWTILEEAIADPEPAVAQAALTIGRWDIAPRHAAAYAALVLAAGRHPDRNTALAAWNAYPSWSAQAPGGTATIADAVADLDNRTTWRQAAHALVWLLDSGVPEDTAAALIERLLSATGQPDALADRDLPARRRIATLCSDLDHWARTQDGTADLAPVAAAGRLLAAHPEYLAEGCTLLVAATLPYGPEPGLAAIADRLHDRPLAAARTAEAVETWYASRTSFTPEPLLATAEALSTRGDLPGGLLSLALVVAVAKATPERRPSDPAARGLVARLRRHPEAEVRTLALNLATAPE